MSPVRLTDHPAHRYARDVLGGKVVAGELVGLACERYLRDRRDAKRRGIHFDRKAAQRVLDFFPRFLRHSKGEWAGQSFKLQPWQQFRLWNVFGWKRADGSRRFREAYNELARKNGKTTECAGVGLYLTAFDGEPGAEVYTAATKMDQARIMHREAIEMVKRSRGLSEIFKPLRDNLIVEEVRAKYEPLGRDAQRLDGLNVSGALVDELHAHPNGDLYDVLDTGTGARRQPLLFIITTAGSNLSSFCYGLREHAVDVLRGTIEDDAFFAFIACLDKGDSWTDEKVWAKANPNLGVSVKVRSIREAVARSKSSPAKQNATRRYRLNEWVDAAEDAFLRMDRWDECAGELMPAEIETACRGLEAFGGLDVSSTEDVTAFGVVVPHDDAPWDVFWRFWIPEEDLDDRVRRTKVPYDQWVRDGWLLTTEGAVIDQGEVLEEIQRIAEWLELHEIAYDPWNAGKLVSDLEAEGFETVKVPNNYAAASEPTKTLGALTTSRGLRHGGHPVARWMAANLRVREHEGAIRPVKPKSKMSHRKIDGMVALVLALDRASRGEGESELSVYATRGMVSA